MKNKENKETKEEIVWLSTEKSGVSVRVSKDSKNIMFFLNDGSNKAFSYSIKYFQKILENNK